MMLEKSYTFSAKLVNLGEWRVVYLPKYIKLKATQPFGRTPVIAQFCSQKWKTSLWTDKEGKTMLPIPKKIRGKLDEGDMVEVYFEFDYERF